ncbi:MAG TPA: polyprenol monophosphomannose synthase [Actinomycetes bacterium]|nr:polyprenol monophosphomannose synthase [Actinomycetes bacterium]
MSNHTTFAMRENAGLPFSRTPQPTPKLAVLVPTRNEAANIEELLRRISAAVTGIPTEIVFVDDSDDDTPAVIRGVARRRGGGACRVSLIHRRDGQRTGGLGGAVVNGLGAADARWVCVLDGDLQHPPEVIPRLLAAAEGDRADLVVASRYCGTGRTDGLGAARTLISTACGSAAKLLFPMRLHGVTDPMSGFFLVRRSAVRLDQLRPRGFKILLELLVRHGGLRATEVGYIFADRHAGESKGTLREGLTYLRSLAGLRLGRGTPPPSRTAADAVQLEPLAPLAWHTRTRTVGG